jgi:hypothetical protein
VTVWAALVVAVVCEAKLRVVGERVAVGAAATAVPLRATVWGEVAELLKMVSVPIRVPLAVGLNVICTPHPEPGEIRAEHVLICEKSPVMVIELIMSAFTL